MVRLKRRWIHWCRRPRGEADAAHVLVGGALARLNPVAAWVWEEAEGVSDRAALLRRMRRRYRGVEDRRLALDLDRLLDGWLREGWIETETDPVFPFPEDPWPA